MNLRRWLAALSFPFLILAGVLIHAAWSAHRGYSDPLPQWKLWLYCALAGLSLFLALLGVRARHRSDG